MALSKEEIATNYPLPVYNYRVEIGEETIAFSKVSGLNLSFETTTYKESPVEGNTAGPRIMYMPSQIAETQITLEKGVVQGVSVSALYAWINSTQTNQIDKKDIFVRLCDHEGATVLSWKVLNAFPTKLDAPTFDASSNEVAVETMELKADRVELSEA